MPAPIDFYFDFTSPYGYLGSTRIDALAAAHGRTVHWHPLLLGAVFSASGSVPMMEHPVKAAYSWRDLERSARFHGIAYRQPSRFPQSTQAAARAMLWLQREHGHAVAVRFAHAVFAALFVENRDVSSVAPVLEIAAAADAGIDIASLSEAVGTAIIKDALKAEVAMAIERGVFGAPFIIVDGESFWGFDRYPQIDAFLQNGHA